jgi:epsin
MVRRSGVVLGKRARRTLDAEDETCVEPKRSRARRSYRAKPAVEPVSPKPATTKPRSGLLTPEPSTLAESQLALTREDEPPPHCTVFPFMKLPAELRLHIYHMALVRAEPLILHAERVVERAEEDAVPRAAALDQQTTDRSGTPWPVANSRALQIPQHIDPVEEHPHLKDPVVPEILRLNQQIYKEARQLLYAENVFTLNLASGIHTLSTLHQRSRSLIKHVILTIPSHHDILDGFADLVRLGLRYCWGLKCFKIILQASLPGDDGRANGATSVYANAFHILRWLPRGCSVVLEGCVSETVRRVVVEEGRLMTVLDEVSVLK